MCALSWGHVTCCMPFAVCLMPYALATRACTLAKPPLNLAKPPLKCPQTGHSNQYCQLADTGSSASCSVTISRTETFSVTSTDSISRSFGTAVSQGLTEGLTQGKEQGKTVNVSGSAVAALRLAAARAPNPAQSCKV